MNTEKDSESQKSHYVSLNTESSEYQRILEYLQDREIKSNQHKIYVKAYADVYQYQREDNKVHQVVAERNARLIVEENKVNCQNNSSGKIYQAHKKSLLEILLDRIEIIRPNKYGIASE